ncbi:TPA: lipid-A-disaccharide synthase [Candidatus Scatousia excrementigallinarum]|uniref:Lipid-A-disaccharide synthase n=1 Tax=Candidatus Scatousia excrementigallinarum TaxID=2840935 RepID=A0A9D1JNY4_9BACT|nr:lipid-A-disaccharide synthase [Candidatus Scatousia excrementigallinarum]
MKKVFIVTGEYSGDIHAGKVAEELKKLNSDIELEGIGGENLKKAGVKLFSDQKKMGAVGLSPKIIMEHITLGKRVVDYLTREFKPDLVLLTDYGAFNLSISKFLKKAGIKVFYYIPPQVWASRPWRLKTIKKNIDKVLCIFPFEKKLYEDCGIKTHYCGHPLVSQLPEKANREEFFTKHGFDPNKKLVSVFPGSRVFELQQLMGVFIKSVELLQKKHPELQFCISHAPNLSDKDFYKYIKDSGIKVIKGENQALLSVSDALILASGTVALEAALYATPMIIAYRGPWLFYFIYLIVRCIKMVSLPNIISGKLIVPEIIQGNVNADNISYNIEKILYDTSYRENYIKSLKGVRELLSDKVSSKEAAKEISNELLLI